MRAFLGLGANLGDPPGQLAAAIAELERRSVRVVARSALYRTAPLGPTQPDFVNAVVEVETDHSPRQLLEAALAVERSLGRRRATRWGPRTIDIDILLFEDRRVLEPGLQIPHPGLAERAFALVPLAEIAPHAVHPLLGRTVAELRDGLEAGTRAAVSRMDIGWPRTLGFAPR
jgi:2-amino-4-hydroxy-6-hydroxymethyldihydropteridine diphosphokinase